MPLFDGGNFKQLLEQNWPWSRRGQSHCQVDVMMIDLERFLRLDARKDPKLLVKHAYNMSNRLDGFSGNKSFLTIPKEMK